MNNIQERITASFKSQTMMETLGAELELIEDGEVHILLPFSKQLSQQHGYIHAGAISSILDSACGYAALTKVPRDYDVVTAEYKINFLKPAIGERFLAIGKVQSSGKTLSICTGEVRSFSKSDCKVIAIMQATIASIQNA